MIVYFALWCLWWCTISKQKRLWCKTHWIRRQINASHQLAKYCTVVHSGEIQMKLAKYCFCTRVKIQTNSQWRKAKKVHSGENPNKCRQIHQLYKYQILLLHTGGKPKKMHTGEKPNKCLLAPTRKILLLHAGEKQRNA